MIIIEGIVMCFWLLIVCVVGIADGAVGLVIFYEQDVKERVIELGLTTKEKIKKTTIIYGISLFVPVLVSVPLMVYQINGADGFWSGFIQMTAIFLIMSLFDRIFIDWYWVGHTKAWIIPGTEDLQPYITKKALFRKWAETLIGFPMISALLAGIVELIR